MKIPCVWYAFLLQSQEKTTQPDKVFPNIQACYPFLYFPAVLSAQWLFICLENRLSPLLTLEWRSNVVVCQGHTILWNYNWTFIYMSHTHIFKQQSKIFGSKSPFPTENTHIFCSCHHPQTQQKSLFNAFALYLLYVT